MIDKVQNLIDRYSELEQHLASPEIAADIQRMERLSREYNSLGKKIPLLKEYIQTVSDIEESRLLLKTESDQEFIAMLKDELEKNSDKLPVLEEKVKILLVPEDPLDSKNAILEIRAGTGGTEAGIFAADLFRMYSRYIENHGWKTEILSAHYGDVGSIKEIIFLINGADVYGALKYESGVHRVQRVPQTETQGRIHTSAASVAVFPEADEVEVAIDPGELRIDVYRASGAGGQHVNKTESAVRIVHIPSGITVTCQDEKSQHKNKSKAMKVLQTRLFDKQISEVREKESRQRKSMVGTGDRSAKIRTYNFPQGRVTDHRIELTLYKLEAIMNGDLQELIDALEEAEVNEKIKHTV
jgi:peptide chain release factor 1